MRPGIGSLVTPLSGDSHTLTPKGCESERERSHRLSRDSHESVRVQRHRGRRQGPRSASRQGPIAWRTYGVLTVPFKIPDESLTRRVSVLARATAWDQTSEVVR